MVHIQMLRMILFVPFAKLNSFIYFLKKTLNNMYIESVFHQPKWAIIYFHLLFWVYVSVSVWDCLLWLSYKLSLAIDSTLFPCIPLSLSLCWSQYDVEADARVLWMKNDDLKSASHHFGRCTSSRQFHVFFSFVTHSVRDKKTVTQIAFLLLLLILMFVRSPSLLIFYSTSLRLASVGFSRLIFLS